MFKLTSAIIIALWIFVAVSWFTNLFKLTECDFEAPFKCEAVHGIGLIPVVSVVTAWIDVED